MHFSSWKQGKLSVCDCLSCNRDLSERKSDLVCMYLNIFFVSWLFNGFDLTLSSDENIFQCFQIKWIYGNFVFKEPFQSS